MARSLERRPWPIVFLLVVACFVTGLPLLASPPQRNRCELRNAVTQYAKAASELRFSPDGIRAIQRAAT
jgi:hypothetical protein